MDEHLRHRTDLGGGRLDIASEGELIEDFEAMRARISELRAGGRAPDFEVQAMAPSGVACVLRGAEDPLFGPVVSFGLAGDAVELLGDVAHRVPPLTTSDVHDLEDIIARISHLSDDNPEEIGRAHV